MFKKFLPVIALTFVNVIGFSILIPVLPQVTEQYISSDFSAPVYGALIAAYSLFQFLGSPVLGSLSDKYGRKPLLILSQLGTTLSWVIFAVAYFLPNVQLWTISLPIIVIAISRIVDGITGGNISVAQAWVSDVTSPKEKTKAFGLLGAVFGLAFLFGPAIGGFSSSTSIGYLGTCIVAFLISLVTLALILFYLPESLPEEKRDKELDIHLFKEINIFHKIKVFDGNQFVLSLLAIRLGFALVLGGFFIMIILYMREGFGLTTTGLGLTMSLIGTFSIFNQAFLVGKLSKRFGDLNTFYFSLSCFFVSLLTLPLIPTGIVLGPISVSYLLMLANAYIINCGISFGMPTFKSILANNVSEKRQGLATGIDESLLALGNSVTPILAGVLYSAIGINTFYAFAVVLGLPFLYVFAETGTFLVRPQR